MTMANRSMYIPQSQKIANGKVAKTDYEENNAIGIASNRYPTNPYFEYVRDPLLLDYNKRLRQYGAESKVTENWIYVGKPIEAPGWILYISCTSNDAAKALDVSIPYLIEKALPFMLIRGLHSHILLNNGALGIDQVAKVVTIPTNSVEAARQICDELAAFLPPLKTPRPENAVKVGNCLFASYAGNVNEKSITDGWNRLHITACSLPRRKDVPFPTSNEDWKKTRPRKFVGGWYMLQTRKTQHAKGNTYSGIAINRLFKDCIIKEAKENAAVDPLNRSSADRLRWQDKVIRTIKDRLPVPKTFPLIEQDGYTYLPMETVDGETMVKVLTETQTGKSWNHQPVAVKRILLQYYCDCLRLLAGLHECKYLHRDFCPANIIRRPNGNLVLIDMELAYPYTNPNAAPPFFSGTPGYRAPEQFAYQRPTIKEDIHSAGAFLGLILTGEEPVRIEQNCSRKFRPYLARVCNDRDLVDLATVAMNDEPANRPDLQTMIAKIEEKLKFIE